MKTRLQTEQQKKELKLMLITSLFSKLSEEDQSEIIAHIETLLEKA